MCACTAMALNHVTFAFVFSIVRNGSGQESKENSSSPQAKTAPTSFSPEHETSSNPPNRNSDGQEKKIWTRGEFTHQNSGIGGSDDNEEYSRYKYVRFGLFFKNIYLLCSFVGSGVLVNIFLWERGT